MSKHPLFPTRRVRSLGGSGSGNFGHSGRPGERGGSGSGGGGKGVFGKKSPSPKEDAAITYTKAQVDLANKELSKIHVPSGCSVGRLQMPEDIEAEDERGMFRLRMNLPRWYRHSDESPDSPEKDMLFAKIARFEDAVDASLRDSLDIEGRLDDVVIIAGNV